LQHLERAPTAAIKQKKIIQMYENNTNVPGLSNITQKINKNQIIK
jgi:hypothetical protein